MCGIAGHCGPHDPAWVEAMSRALAHRGPDGEGLWTAPARNDAAPLTLAHRRLAILDLSGGMQPMHSADGSLCVVFNGEIFNAPELRKELQGKGHVFRTANSDTEVLLALYAASGDGMLARLRGMFSFALYDARAEQLFCARDHTGIKPFYYARQGYGQGRGQETRFAFASELKALAVLPWVSRRVDRKSLYHYLSLQFVPAPRTILADVCKLPKGHWLRHDLRSGETRTGEYWNLPLRPEERPRAEWAGLVREAVEDAVRAWSLSDVPVACSLSGGMDSSVVTALASRSGPVRTYSLGFTCAEGQGLDELPLARLVAKKWGTVHSETTLECGRLLQDLDRMVRHLDEPYAGGLPSWYVYEMIGRDVKVALTGTGGDELFGNYFKWKRYEDGPEGLARVTAKELKHWAAAEREEHALRYPLGHYYARYFSDAAKNAVLLAEPPAGGAAGQGAAPTEALLQSLWERSGADNPRDAVAWIDFQLQLPEEFLLVADRFAMAHSVEARTPLLDHRLVELVYRIPACERTGLDPKALFREALGDLLPPELLSAPKRGFVLPLTAWTRGELADDIRASLCPSALHTQGLFSPALWSEVVQPHLAGAADHTQQVWTVYMFQRWFREFGA